MSTKERDELVRKSLQVSRQAFDRWNDPPQTPMVILGALIRAVELLAGERAQEPSEKLEAFDDGLVMRLTRVLAESMRQPGPVIADHVRAILTELAAMPVETPTQLDVMGIINDGGTIAFNIAAMYRARLGPILAAKDARIAELEQRGERIVELELTNEASRQRIAELEKRLAEQTTPVDATGKTPGQVLKSAIAKALADGEPHYRQAEIGARAVLRAFGQNTADALRFVRGRIGGMVIEAANEKWYAFGNNIRKQAQVIIDDELTKLEGQRADSTGE